MDWLFDALAGAFLATGVTKFVLDIAARFVVQPGGGRLSFHAGPVVGQEVMQMDVLRLTNEERVLLTVTALTAHGRPAAIDGPVLFESSSPGVEIVRVSDTSAYAVAMALGTARVTAAADADLGAGVETIAGLLDIEVLAAKAVSLGISAGTPEAQPVEETTHVTEVSAPPADVPLAGDAAEPATV